MDVLIAVVIFLLFCAVVVLAIPWLDFVVNKYWRWCDEKKDGWKK